jgi:hypothetical protein
MLSAVGLNHNSKGHAREVHHVWMHRMLPPEMPTNAVATQAGP